MARKATVVAPRQPVEAHAHTVDSFNVITGTFRNMDLAAAYRWLGDSAILCEGLRQDCDMHSTADVRKLPNPSGEHRVIASRSDTGVGAYLNRNGTTRAPAPVTKATKKALGTMEVITDKQGRKVQISTRASHPGEWVVSHMVHGESVTCYSAAEALAMAGLLDAWCDGCDQ